MIHWALFLAPLVAAPHEGLHQQITALSRLIEDHPGEAQLHLRRAELYRLHREWDLALADSERAEAIDQSLAEPDLVRGRVWLARGELERAEAALDRFLSRRAGDVEGLLARAEVRVLRGALEGAAMDYTQAIEAQPRPLPDHYVARARAVAARGPEHCDAAIAGLDEGIAVLGPVVTLELEAVDLERDLGRHDAALARISVLEGQSVRRERWLALRGDVLSEAGRPREALEAWTCALEAIDGLPPRHRSTRAVLDLEARIREDLRRMQEP